MRTGRAHSAAKRSVNFAQTKVLRRGDRVDAATESRFDRSFRNPKGFKGFDEAKKPLRRNVALGFHRFLALLDRGVDDVARNERENAIPHSSRGAIREEFVKVAFVGNSVASFLRRPIMWNEKEERCQDSFVSLSQAKARTFDISSRRPSRPQPLRRRASSARFLPPSESTVRKYSNRRASTRRRRRSPSPDVDKPSKFCPSLDVDRAETVSPNRFARRLGDFARNDLSGRYVRRAALRERSAERILNGRAFADGRGAGFKSL